MIPGPTQQVKDLIVAAVTQIQSLAWETFICYRFGHLKKKKKRKKKKEDRLKDVLHNMGNFANILNSTKWSVTLKTVY